VKRKPLDNSINAFEEGQDNMLSIRKCKKFKLLTGFSAFTLSQFIGLRTSYAQNAYAKQQYNQTNVGGYFQSVNGQVDLFPPSIDPNKNIFVTKEMWLLDTSGNWVETGSVKGYTAPDGISATTYWAGEYYARQKIVNGNPVYQRKFIGTSGSTGSKIFQVNVGQASGSSYSWNFYLNNSYAGSFDSPKSSFPYAQVGIETNNGCSNYRNGTYADSLYILTPSKTWAQWGSNVIDGDNKKVAAWDSVYSSASQRITFSSGAKPASCP
jgi:hypothetical protein